jgi:glycosyltransferase involved in cell wall biosynthesis
MTVFSVVIPAYNRAASISKAIDSVFAQSLSDFEVVIVDDGSKDETASIVKRYNDGRIKYVYQDNAGGSSARNTGVNHSQGQYIAFLDSDDIFLPHHLESALVELEKADNICVFTQVIVERDDELTFLKPPRGPKPDEHFCEYLMNNRGFVQTSTLVVPRQIACQVRFDTNISAGQDKDFAIKLTNFGARLVMLAKPGAVWDDRWSENRLSSRSNYIQRIDWLNRIRPTITQKAYDGEMGWHIAKAMAHAGNRFGALKWYFKALIKGCYSAKLSAVIFFQILLSKNGYRKFSDCLASIGIKP